MKTQAISDCEIGVTADLNVQFKMDHLSHMQIRDPTFEIRNRIVLSLLGLTLFLFSGQRAAQAQQSTFLLNCAGTNDNIELDRMRASLGTNGGTLKMTAKNGARCAVGNATIPANITLDNTEGVGITVNTGQTFTILGSIVNPSNKQLFFNALSGQGTVSFAGNKYLTVVSPEWWGAKTTKDDSAALNACSAAAATLVAADIDLANSYNLSSTWQVGAGSPFSYISLKGHGAGNGGTTLNWIGPRDGVMVKFWANKFANIERLRFQNVGLPGKTVAVRLAGPGSGTQSNSYDIDNSVFTGFYCGLQAGDPTTTAAASELSFRNVSFDGNTNGFIGTSSGNTLVISFLNCSFANNTAVGLDIGSAGDCHVFGGGFGSNGVDIHATPWTNTLAVIGARFELVDPEIALSVAGVGTVMVSSSLFISEPARTPKKGIITGNTNLTLQSNTFGRAGDSLNVYDFGAGGKGSDNRLVATSNIVNGHTLAISRENTAVDGLKTLIDGISGEVVWPNLVPNNVSGEGRLASGSLHVKLTKRRDPSYSISLSSNADERLHFANKTVEGFDIVSSDRASTAMVTWAVVRN